MRRFSVSKTVLLIICLMYLILYVDRVNISTAAPLIKADQAREPANGSCCSGRRGHDQAADAKRKTRAEFIDDITTDQLKQRVRIGERRKKAPARGYSHLLTR